MKKIQKEKIVFFEQSLSDFFQKVGREHLPWRKKNITAYEVWVSEIMLQQTQVLRVIDYYARFLKKYPTVESLARSNWNAFLPYYKGLGYYARGRNMLRAAQEIVEKYNGIFPREVEVLQKLPGIGPYTAAAIASFAYGENTMAWDTNLRRVIGRFFFGTKHFLSAIPDPTRNLKSKKGEGVRSRIKSEMIMREFEEKFSLPAKTSNAALMDFGSAICLARPKCEACSLHMRCVYFREKGAQESANKKQSTKNKKQTDWRSAQVFVFLHENHKKYFSAEKKRYEPFVIPKEYNTRAGIKDWFRKNYRLEVSVRPPFRKKAIRMIPTLFVNAQILSGKPFFSVFQKSDREAYNERVLR